MSLRRSFLAAVVLAVVAFVCGCGPRWAVIHEATPDPFVNQPSFAVEPVHFEGMMVGDKSEADYQSGKSPEQQQSWQADKQGMTAAFQQGLVDHAAPIAINGVPPAANQFVIRPIVTFVEPGFYAAIARGDTSVNMTLQLVGPDGRTIYDEITMSSRISATMTNPSSGGRMRDAALDLGAVTAKYIKKRTGAE